jgi:hypothetical protein
MHSPYVAGENGRGTTDARAREGDRSSREKTEQLGRISTRLDRLWEFLPSRSEPPPEPTFQLIQVASFFVSCKTDSAVVGRDGAPSGNEVWTTWGLAVDNVGFGRTNARRTRSLVDVLIEGAIFRIGS